MARESFRPIWAHWCRRNADWRRPHRSEIVWCLMLVATSATVIRWRVGDLTAVGTPAGRLELILIEIGAIFVVAGAWPLIRIVSRIDTLQRSGVIDQYRVTPIPIPEMILDLLRISWLIPVVFFLVLNLILIVDGWPVMAWLLLILTLLAIAQAQYAASVGLRVSLGQRSAAQAVMLGIALSVILPLVVFGLVTTAFALSGNALILIVAFFAFLWWQGRMARIEVKIREWAAERLARE